MDLVNVYRYSQNSNHSWIRWMEKIKVFIFIFENVASFSSGIEKYIVKYLETYWSNSNSLIMIAELGGSIKNQWCHMATYSVFSMWKWVTWKTEKKCRIYWTNFRKIFTKMIPLCLTILTLVIDNLGNLGQSQNVQKGSVLKDVYF